MLTLGQAAREVGVAKGTLSKAIKTGKLSATRREDGSWCIDGAELARYVEANGHRFPAGNGADTVAGERAETIAELRAKVELAEARLSDLKAALLDMQQQRDKWETVATRLSLPAPKPEEKPEPAGIARTVPRTVAFGIAQREEPAPQSWWRWLRSTG